MYAHVTNGIVDAVVGSPPYIVRTDERDWDLRSLDPVVLAEAGWYPVLESPRPADTASTTWVPVFQPAFVDGVSVVMQSWQEVPKSAEQLDAENAATNESTIRDRARQALDINAAFLANGAPSNAQVLAQVRALTKQATGLIKLDLRDLDSADGTL